ncbi:MAG: AbrB/MazE/SpoVT family DNA-binding domain-containing protein [Candidatus Diapherotrites archaeon]|nr:AbrB/MazE/SpoVT family DNA-binding domain-containing protein [Candidatus Diapherotrites archaeon]
MQTITLSSKYQIVIPKQMREDMNLRPGQKLVLIEKGDSIQMVRIGKLKDMAGFVKGLTQDGLRDESERFD